MIRDFVSHIGAYGVEQFDEDVNDHIWMMQSEQRDSTRVVRVASIQYAVEVDNPVNDSYYTALIHFTVEESE